MRPDLRLVDGGARLGAAGGEFDQRIENNVIHLSRRSWYGHRPPSVIEICDLVMPHLDPELHAFAAEVVRVFLEMSGDSWLRSRHGSGLFVSLARKPWNPVGRMRPRTRMGIEEPRWTVTVRPPPDQPRHYHVHLPPIIGDGVVVPITRVLGHHTRCSGTRHLITFRRDGEGWSPTQHTESYLSRNYDDGPSICPTLLRSAPRAMSTEQP